MSTEEELIAHLRNMRNEFPSEDYLWELEKLKPQLLPIVIGALLESWLSKLIDAKLPDNNEAKALAGVNKFASYANLAKLARGLGLISAEVYDMLVEVGRIRNHYAHTSDPKESEIRAGLVHLDELLTDRTFHRGFYGAPKEMRESFIRAAKASARVKPHLARGLLIRTYHELCLSLNVSLYLVRHDNLKIQELPEIKGQGNEVIFD